MGESSRRGRDNGGRSGTLAAEVTIGFASQPTGARLVVGSSRSASPFSRTVIVGSTNSVSAPSTRTRKGKTYLFQGWSDGGTRTHDISAPSTDTTYKATFRAKQ